MLNRDREITLNLTPRARFDLINVSQILCARFADFLSKYRRAVYLSCHTTAGYLDPGLCSRLDHDSESLQAFVRSFQRLFPQGANYQHDRLHLRAELSEEQRLAEPRNADAHLTFIGSGFTNCVTYPTRPGLPVYFIDLDGINGQTRRQRQTTIMGFNEETVVGEYVFSVPLSNHPVDSVNLKDERLGLFEELQFLLRKHKIAAGRINLDLKKEERDAGLTVNEYETLLMKHDLLDVLRNPVRFAAEKGRHMLSDPRAILIKAKDYAKYDLVQIINELVDSLGLNESILERIIHKFLALPASRFLRMKRSVSLLVSDQGRANPEILEGTYQSPILVQWRKASAQSRQITASFVRFR